MIRRRVTPIALVILSIVRSCHGDKPWKAISISPDRLCECASLNPIYRSETRIEHNFLPTDDADVAFNQMRRDRRFRDLRHGLLNGY
jgi:hypothetical protein